MKAIIWLVFALSFFGSCQRKSENLNQTNANSNVDSIKIILDTSNITMLNYDSTMYWLFDKASPVSLNMQEISKVMTLAYNFVEEYNHTSVDYWKINDFENYQYQFVAVLNNQGQKEVWVNAYCGDREKSKDLILVMDGGKCYFNLKINLATEKCFDFGINGEA